MAWNLSEKYDIKILVGHSDGVIFMDKLMLSEMKAVIRRPKNGFRPQEVILQTCLYPSLWVYLYLYEI